MGHYKGTETSEKTKSRNVIHVFNAVLLKHSGYYKALKFLKYIRKEYYSKLIQLLKWVTKQMEIKGILYNRSQTHVVYITRIHYFVLL